MKSNIFMAALLLAAQSSLAQSNLTKEFKAQNKSVQINDHSLTMPSKKEKFNLIQTDEKLNPVKAELKSLDLKSISLGQDRGGGDIACEGRIKAIKEDLVAWIKQGGYKSLDLKSRGTPMQYADRMLLEMNKTSIECVGQSDPGFPVLVFGIAKTCAIDIKKSENRMTCDFHKVAAYTEEDLYKQIHHEYATAAGFEKPKEGDSDYGISNQLTNYLEKQLVLKLVIKNDLSKSLNLENLREGMKFSLSRDEVSTYDCSAEGEGFALSPFNYVHELDKMTAIRKSYVGEGKHAYFEYVFSYIDENDVKYEERITTSDEKVLSSVGLTILRKQKVNVGSVEDPEFKMEHVPSGKMQCKINIAN